MTDSTGARVPFAPTGVDVSPPTPADAGTVDAMLAATGITVSEDERELLVQTFALYRSGIAALHAVEEARYEAPALVFQAAPKLDEWRT